MTLTIANPPLRLGFFTRLLDQADAAERYRLATAQIMYAERCGFDSAWVAQHHFHEDESGLPAPFVFLSQVAARTTRIRLGTGILTLPLELPVRVARRRQGRRLVGLQQTEMVDENDGVRVLPHRLGAVIESPPAQEIDRRAMLPGGGERPVEARVGRIGNLFSPQHQPDPDCIAGKAAGRAAAIRQVRSSAGYMSSPPTDAFPPRR